MAGCFIHFFLCNLISSVVGAVNMTNGSDEQSANPSDDISILFVKSIKTCACIGSYRFKRLDIGNDYSSHFCQGSLQVDFRLKLLGCLPKVTVSERFIRRCSVLKRFKSIISMRSFKGKLTQ